jgi:hypothetical protein
VLPRLSRLRASILAVLILAAAVGCSSSNPIEYPSKALENFKSACVEANTTGSNRLSGSDLTTFCGIPDQNDNTLASDKTKDGCVLSQLRDKYPKFDDFKTFDTKLRDFLKTGDKSREELAANVDFKDFVTITDSCTAKGP